MRRYLLLRTLTATAIVAAVAAVLPVGPAAHAAEPAPTAVATYQSIGLYWQPATGSPTNTAGVTYRDLNVVGSPWLSAMPLWWDARTIGGRAPEYRGSIVGLQQGTNYEVRISLADRVVGSVRTRTWSTPNRLPVARVVSLGSSGPVTLSESGTSAGYVVYDGMLPTGGPATITAAETDLAAVTIAADYVVLRNVNVRGGTNGVGLSGARHHVVVRDNDIAGWGPRCSAPGGCGNMQAGVRTLGSGTASQVTVQRNRIHDPAYNSNTWPAGGHPKGPQGIVLGSGSQNNVIRFNEITSTVDHLFNDGMGNLDNFTLGGFPQSDSDVNGNVVMHTADDALEVEGANMNVRVWGNYIDRTFTGIASAAVTVGPLYIFRNVTAHSDNDPRDPVVNTAGQFAKAQDDAPSASGGRRYVIANTLLQPTDGPGLRGGIYATGGTDRTIRNTVSRNNLWQGVGRPYAADAVFDVDFDHDLSWKASPLAGLRHVVGVPVFAPGHGNDAGRSGRYALHPASPGYDRGAVLPNFTDRYNGSGPDIGAVEAGSAAMQFGVGAYPGL